MIRGSCLCGAVRFETDGPLRPVIACHCRQCQKTSGNFVAATAAPRDGLRILGEVTWYGSSGRARRGFCGICGAPMFWDGPGTHLSIFAGAVDDVPDLALAGHIFCAARGSWDQITDGLPQAAGADPALTTMVPE